MQRPSIGKTLFRSLTLSLFTVWLIAAAGIVWVVKHETDEIFNSSLEETAQRLLQLAVHDLTTHDANDQADISGYVEHEEYLSYRILNSSGTVLLRSHNAPGDAEAASFQSGHYQAGNRHYYGERSRFGDFLIQVFERPDHRTETFTELLKVLAIPLLALLPLVVLVVKWSIRSAEKPIVQFGHAISTRGSHDLHPLDTESLPEELLSVGQSTNALMERLRLSLEAERNFAANSAHELRTPIATAMAQLDVLRDELKETGARKRVTEARDMMERLEQMTVKLLQLARAESGVGMTLSRIDLKPIVQMLVRDLSFRSSRTVNLSVPENPTWINADVDAVGIVLQNLLQNAERYAPPETPVEVDLTLDGLLSVRNDSEAIPEDVLKSLHDRFARANQSKLGSGIGLSIVDTILKQSGAKFQLRSPCYDSGRGFEAIVKFGKPSEVAPDWRC